MPVSIKGSGGGSVTLDAGAAASDTTLTLPNTTGTVALTASPTFSGTLTATTITSPASTALTIQSAGTTAMTVNTSQNVGIGTTTPARKLDIEESGTNYQMRIGDAGGSNYYDIGRDTSNGLLTFYGSQAVASGYVFSTVNGERARIDTSGNLLVGQTSNWTSGLISTRAGNSNGISAQSAASASGYSAFIARTDRTDCNLTAFYFGTTQVGSITTNTSSTAYNTSSDYRLKENVRPMISGLATVSALKPVTYDWVRDKSQGEGFIAHELQGVIPQAVTGEKDAVNDDGSIRPQGVDYSKIVVHLVAAIQELSAKNDALEAANAAFEARLAALEAK